MSRKPSHRRQAAAAKPGSRSRPARSEVVIVGSGAVGAACASALARKGLAVRVLSHPGRSTTAVSGGHLLLQSRGPGPKLEAARRSVELVAEFARGREEALRYRRTGSLLLAVTDEECEALRAHVEALTDAGIAVGWWSGDQARELEPLLSPAVKAASYCGADAQIDPAALAGAWLQDALAHGAALNSGAAVEGFVTSGGAVVGVVAGGVEFAASAVVLAAGPWSAEIAALAWVNLELRPRRGLLLRAHSADPIAGRPLLGAAYLAAKHAPEPSAVAFSFQQHPDGECILGGTRDFAGFEAGDLDAASEAVRACGARYLPVVNHLRWERREVGFRPWTPTGVPYVGPSGVPGLLLACGHEGDGITLAADTALRIAELVAPS